MEGSREMVLAVEYDRTGGRVGTYWWSGVIVLGVRWYRTGRRVRSYMGSSGIVSRASGTAPEVQ